MQVNYHIVLEMYSASDFCHATNVFRINQVKNLKDRYDDVTVYQNHLLTNKRKIKDSKSHPIYFVV